MRLEFLGVLALLGIIGLFFVQKPKPESEQPTKRGVGDTRGIRNNNPGNIRWDGVTRWRGMIGQDDQNFVIFSEPVFGIRAMVRDLLTGFRRDGENTIREIISEWAPPNENNTTAYINSVAKQTGFQPDQELNEQNIKPLLRAIVRHENGTQPYDTTLYDHAIALAGTGPTFA